MKSILFVVTRALATRNVQAALQALWVWWGKTVAQWDDALAAMSVKESTLSVALVAMRAQAQALDTSMGQIDRFVRDVVRMGKVKFRDQPEKLALFDAVALRLRNRADIQKTGRAAHDVWASADAAWVPLPGLTLSALGSLLSTAEAQEAVLSQKRTAWRVAGIALMQAAESLDRDNVGWFSDACVRFPADTEQGQLIRSQVPTTTVTPAPIGQAVIANLMVAGREIHFDVSAAHATSYTYYHLLPGETVWVTELEKVPQTSLTLHDQAVGEHRFKVTGSNSRGTGPVSAEAVVVIAESVAA